MFDRQCCYFGSLPNRVPAKSTFQNTDIQHLICKTCAPPLRAQSKRLIINDYGLFCVYTCPCYSVFKGEKGLFSRKCYTLCYTQNRFAEARTGRGPRTPQGKLHEIAAAHRRPERDRAPDELRKERCGDLPPVRSGEKYVRPVQKSVYLCSDARNAKTVEGQWKRSGTSGEDDPDCRLLRRGRSCGAIGFSPANSVSNRRSGNGSPT